MSGMNLYDFSPVIWFNLHTITVNSNETGTCHYKSQDNIQSAYWSNWNKHRRKISVLWTIGEHWEFTFISQLAACLYRPLHMYCTLLHPRMQSLHGYRKFFSSHSHHKWNALLFIRNQTETSTWVRLPCSHQTKPGRCENTLKPHLFHFYLNENFRGLL